MKLSKYLQQIEQNILYNYKDKSANVNAHIAYMLARTQSMFRWSGLPATIPARMLELYLQTNGNVCIAAVPGGDLYAFTGGMGGEPNAYYMPTVYTVANPALKLSRNYKIDEDCVVIPSDSLYLGLLPMAQRYATGLTETELSIFQATVNSRAVSLISASDDRTKSSAEEFVKKLVDGDLSIIAESAFLDGVRSQPYGNSGTTQTISDLIELEQYLRAGWFNDLGLNANYNMKREALNSAETGLNDDALLPLVDDMLKCRKEGAERVNDMYGTDISVEFSSSWEDNAEETELKHEEMAGGTEVTEVTEVTESKDNETDTD